MPTASPVRPTRVRPSTTNRPGSHPIAGGVSALLGLSALAAFTIAYPRPIDFAVYRRAAVAVDHGDAVYLAHGQHLVFTYPPFAALLFAPLAWMSAGSSLELFTLGSLVAAGFVVVLSVRRPGVAAPAVPVVAVGLLALTEPARTTMTLGQVNLVVCALVLLGQTVLRREGRAGALVGLAAGIKITPALFVLAELARGGRTRAAAAAGTFAVTVGVGVLAVVDGRQYWTSLLWQTGRVGDIARYGNQSVRATLARLFGAGTAVTAGWLLLAAVVLACTLAFAGGPIGRSRPVLTAGVTGVGSCLICPVSWGHHWVWCVPLIAGLFTWPTHDRRHRAARRWAWLLLVVFLAGPNTPVVHPLWRWTVGRVVIGNDYVLVGLTVLVWLAVPELLRLARQVAGVDSIPVPVRGR